MVEYWISYFFIYFPKRNWKLKDINPVNHLIKLGKKRFDLCPEPNMFGLRNIEQLVSSYNYQLFSKQYAHHNNPNNVNYIYSDDLYLFFITTYQLFSNISRNIYIMIETVKHCGSNVMFDDTCFNIWHFYVILLCVQELFY